MSKTAISKKTDLSELEPKEASKLNVLAGYISKEKADCVKAILKIGEYLCEVKGIIGTGGRSSQFGPWVESHCRFSIKTANNYIDAFSVFGKKKLETVFQLEPSALYLLAADNSPEDATTEALKRADKGEAITTKVAKEIIAKHNGTPPKPAPPRKSSAATTTAATSPDPEPEAEEECGDEPAEAEVEEELTFEQEVEEENKQIESFCRSLVKFYEENCPQLTWTKDSGRIDSALSNVKAACATLRSAKAVVCPACTEGQNKKGKCGYCKGHGYLPTHTEKTIPEAMRL